MSPDRQRWPWAALPLAALFAAAALPLAFSVSRFVAAPAVDVSSLTPALVFALSGATVATIVGGAIGAATGTLALPARRWTLGISVALIAAPPAFWWIGLTHLPVGFGRLSGRVTASVVAGLAFAPIPLLLALAAAREFPANAYEAARVSLSAARRVWFVLVPLLSPALLAGFVLTTILLLGESEIPFLFGFRTSMTDVVTKFSESFDAGQTVAIVLPLVAAVLVLALLLARPLFIVILPAASGGRGIVRKSGSTAVAVASFILPALVGLSLSGYARAALSGPGGVWRRIPIPASTLLTSIAEPVLCAFAAVALAVVSAYPVRRSPAARLFAVAGLVLFCVPPGVVAIGWIVLGQTLGGLSAGTTVAYVTRLFGLSVLGFLIAYSRLPRSLEDAARLVPMSPIVRAWTLMLPLMVPSLAATAALTAALIFADRDVASLLLGPGESRLMLDLYLLSSNAPSAVIGTTGLVVFSTGAAVIGLAAAGPAVLWVRRRE